MVPIEANGQLAVAAYHLGDGDSYGAFAIVVLATTLTHLSRISLFADPALFGRFGLPLTVARATWSAGVSAIPRTPSCGWR